MPEVRHRQNFPQVWALRDKLRDVRWQIKEQLEPGKVGCKE